MLLVLSLALPPSPAAAVDLACPPTEAATPEGSLESAKRDDLAFPEDETEITVFAAASLTDAFGEIADTIEERYPNITVRVETAGSQTLVTQLTEGAEADVLATADTASMQAAVDADLVGSDPQAFTANQLVIVTPPGNPAGIDGIDDLTSDDIRLVIAGVDVPAGRYARHAICAWAGSDTEAVAAIGEAVVSEEIDVRSVTTKVVLGEADAGIVYASDAASAERSGTALNVIAFPDGIPMSATYPIAPIADGDSDAAESFIAFVLSDDGQRILENHGFTPLS